MSAYTFIATTSNGAVSGTILAHNRIHAICQVHDIVHSDKASITVERAK